MTTKKFDLVITNGRVLDPDMGFGNTAHIFIKYGKIAAIEKDSAEVQRTIKAADKSQVIDAKGKLVVPGLIDIHVHLREPGREVQTTQRHPQRNM